MNSADLIVLRLAAVVFLAILSNAIHRLHRRHTRQQQCFEALQRPCTLCGAFSGSSCVDKQGLPSFCIGREWRVRFNQTRIPLDDPRLPLSLKIASAVVNRGPHSALRADEESEVSKH